MMDRREFVRSMLALTSGWALSGCRPGTSKTVSDALGTLLPLRPLGSTGVQVPMLGLGGFHIGLAETEELAQALIEKSIEGGIRFFDTAEGYAKGLSEERYGRYLIPKYQDHIFLMTKTNTASAEQAQVHLENSLRRMKCEQIDLWQIHAIRGPEDVNARWDQGVVEVVLKAQQEGKVRFVGFTGHDNPHGHVRMLERDKEWVFQTCQMPVNMLDPHNVSFVRMVLPELVQRKMGVLAMKTLGDGRFWGFKKRINWPRGREPYTNIVPDIVSIEEALRYAWSLPISVLITGPDDVPMLEEKIELARSFVPFSEDALDALLARTEEFGKDAPGKWEYYKRFGA
jgi:predicted aldo/keto reductase-like oxidoreductase